MPPICPGQIDYTTVVVVSKEHQSMEQVDLEPNWAQGR